MLEPHGTVATAQSDAAGLPELVCAKEPIGDGPHEPRPARIWYLDTARAALMIFGIPYHAAQPFSDRAWFISAGAPTVGVQIVGDLLHLFRMHAFFVVAGIFSAIMLERRGASDWIRERARRLLVPFGFAVAVILPAQMMILAFVTGHGLQAWAQSMGTFNTNWVAHTWFLRDLFAYCVILAACDHWLGPQPLRLATKGLAIGAFLFLLYGSFLFGLYGALKSLPLLPKIAKAAIVEAAYYAPFFAIGVVLGRDTKGFERFKSWHPIGVTLAIAWLVGVAVFRGRDTLNTSAAVLTFSLANGLIGTWMVLSFAGRFLDRPSRVVRFFVDGAMTIYLVHIAFIFLMTAALMNTFKSSTLEWMVVVICVFGLSSLFYWLSLRVPPLYFLLNGRWLKPSVKDGSANSHVVPVV